MHSITLEIAGLKLNLCFSKTQWKNLFEKRFSKFLSNGQMRHPDMRILVDFIDSHRAKDTKFVYVNQTTTKIFFPDSYSHFELLNFAIKNSFAGILLHRHGCLIHASSAEMEGKGLLFAGASDQGKSSIIHDLGCRILADDRSIIRWNGKHPLVYGSPFYEQNRFTKSRIAFPPAAIFLLSKRRVSKPYADKLPRQEAIFNLMPHVVIREEEPEKQRRVQLKLGIKACQLLAKNVPVYQLFRPLSLAGANLRRSLNEIIA